MTLPITQSPPANDPRCRAASWNRRRTLTLSAQEAPLPTARRSTPTRGRAGREVDRRAPKPRVAPGSGGGTRRGLRASSRPETWIEDECRNPLSENQHQKKCCASETQSGEEFPTLGGPHCVRRPVRARATPDHERNCSA